MKIWNVLWKQSEDKNGKARWVKVGVLIEKNGRTSIKLNFLPVSKDWDGWLVVSEKKEKEESF